MIVTRQLKLLKGRKLKSPTGLEARPTTARVREAVMNLVSNKIKGCNWLDLCSGSGVMGCEALEKGAQTIVAVESNKKNAEICKSNLKSTASGLNQKCNIQIFPSEVIKWLKKWSTSKIFKDSEHKEIFDLVYLDPPYSSDMYSSVLQSLLNGYWINENSIVICEYSKGIPLKASPTHWIEKDRRVYGQSALLLISPAKNCSFYTDSRHLQRGQTQ